MLTVALSGNRSVRELTEIADKLVRPRLERSSGVGDSAEATFVQLTSEPFRYRDAFRFPNGAEVLVQKFDEETTVEVIALALAEDSKIESEDLQVEGAAASISFEQAMGRSMRANA